MPSEPPADPAPPKSDSSAHEIRRLRDAAERNNSFLAVFRTAHQTPEAVHVSEGVRVGDTIGDFRLDARIARGGQGEVWEATQLSMSRKVALKLVLPERVNEKTLALFAREARAGGRLSHPGIVAVHGFGEDDGRHWIAQELIEGAWTLGHFIDEMRDGGELPKDYYRAVAIFVAELADALQAAHDAGVIHRDVKPQNVLVTPDDHPKLTDFGLGRITGESVMSISGGFAGTWQYMSPEQVTAKRIELDQRTDIFSLGVVLYETLALVRPFDGDTTHQITENIVLRDPPDLRKIRSRVPRDLVVICCKALEKLRDARYQTMADFAADLRRYLLNEPIRAQPPTLLERGTKWVRRHPTQSVAVALAAVAFVVISGIGLQIASQADALEAQKTALAKHNRDMTVAKDALLQQTALVQSNTDSMRAKAAEAKASKLAARSMAAGVLRLALAMDCDGLVAQADDLWPARPDMIPSLEAWIAAATQLVGELPLLIAQRDELELQALPPTEEEARRHHGTHPDFLRVAALRAEIAAKSDAADVENLAKLRSELTQLEWGVNERPTWTFPKELEAESRSRWSHNQITGLIAKIRSFQTPRTGLFAPDGVSPEHGWSVPRRLASAESLRDGFAPGGEFAVRWERAAPKIAVAYPGLKLLVQMGLVPIGPDADSKLWEFWHVESGTEPLRGEDGVLRLEETSGLVFVLLPGGKFWMGASSDPAAPHNYDPDAQADESPVHEAELSAFFLSKYEMTQGQWKRLAGENPSANGPDGEYSMGWNRAGLGATLLEPVEQVSWTASVALLDRVELSLPSEAQWEYGARGGQETVWWSGSQKESLQGVANLADHYAVGHGREAGSTEEWLNDGFTGHAPVNTLRANGFGLHHVHGNVLEWCLDGYDEGFYGKGHGTDPVSLFEDCTVRVARGGSFGSVALNARSAVRGAGSPMVNGNLLGLRPAQGIRNGRRNRSQRQAAD